MLKPSTVWLLIIALIFMGCATYQPRVTAFKLPQAYPNVQQVNSTSIGARAWDQEEEARAAFGFNILKAGLLPVQVVFDNKGSQTLQINPSQTFLVNNNNELFPVLDDQMAYERVSQASDFQEAVRGFTKGAFLGGAAGALIGAAVGVVAGRQAGEYAMRGAVAGAATGAVLGAGSGGSSDLGRTITEDLYNRTLTNNPIKPQEMAHGIILFPAEAGRPQALRLQIKEKESEKTYNLNLIL